MVAEINTAYPSHHESEVLLRDGSRILLRPIRTDDAERWIAFFSRLSTRTKYLRFQHIPKEMGLEDATRFCTVDYTNTFALVAEVTKQQHKEIVAIGRYYRLPRANSAEVDFVIEDSYQGKGIGTKLMEHLSYVALDNSITTFEGDVLAENEQMINVLKAYGFHITSELEAGVYHFTCPITRTGRIIKKGEERELAEELEFLRLFLESADFNKLRRESEKYLVEGKKVKFIVRLEKGMPKHEMRVME